MNETTLTRQRRVLVARCAEVLTAAGLAEEIIPGSDQLDRLLAEQRVAWRRNPIEFDRSLAAGLRAGRAFIAELIPQAAQATRPAGSAPAVTSPVPTSTGSAEQ